MGKCMQNLVRKFEWKRHSRDPGVCGVIILKSVLGIGYDVGLINLAQTSMQFQAHVNMALNLGAK
jgi:hypothetical protein